MTRRDPIAEIVAFNAPLLAKDRVVAAEEGGRDLTAEALSRKLEALGRNSFSFFRGTFHLLARDLLQGRVEHAAALAPEGLIVGDLHLENFGVYRGASGALVFDVNDFDDVGFGPADLDVKRLCASALLVPKLARAKALEAAKAIAKAWAQGIERLGGRFPVNAYGEDKAEGAVKSMLTEHGKHTDAELAAKAAPDKGHKHFDTSGSPARYVPPAAHWRPVIEKAIDEYRRALEQFKSDLPGKSWELLDLAYRFKGTGSLGRLRFSALLGHGDDRRVVEIKEARPSALDEARGAKQAGNRARMQAASIRRLQGDPWPFVAGTHLGEREALVRSIQPEEEKLSCEDLAATPDKLASYASQCGEVLARLHVRESAPLLLSADWDPHQAADEAIAFAQSYSTVVEADYQAYCTARDSITARLGLSKSKGV